MKKSSFVFFVLLCISCLLLNTGFVTPKLSVKKTVIVIDAGHGGKDPGKLRSSKKYKHEKELNLIIAKKLGAYLEERVKGVKIIYTRTKDEYVSLERRVEIANNAKANFFVSIHCNSNPKSSVYGTKTHIHSHKFKTSKDLAIRLEKEFDKRAGRNSRGIMSAKDRGYNLFLLQYTKMPGILAEVGFLSNKYEEKYLNSNYGQEIIASAIFRTLREYTQQGKIVPENRGTVYKVQISASNKHVPLDHKSFSKLKRKVVEHKIKGVYKYCVGREYSRELTQKILKEVQKKGYKDAFIVSFSDKK